MQTAVIYQSKYGATETYARWLAEDLGADLLPAGQVKPADLERYGTIVFGGGVYVGSVNGLSLLAKNSDRLRGKRLYLFTVGASDVNDPETPKALRRTLAQKLPLDLWTEVHLYHLRGGMQYSKLSLLHRTMMNLMVRTLRGKPQSELLPYEAYLLQTHGQDIPVTDRPAIAPLVAAIQADQ